LERIDLGLALLALARLPGESLTLEEIAAWCECEASTIHRIERRALAKVRARLRAKYGVDAGSLAR